MVFWIKTMDSLVGSYPCFRWNKLSPYSRQIYSTQKVKAVCFLQNADTHLPDYSVILQRQYESSPQQPKISNPES